MKRIVLALIAASLQFCIVYFFTDVIFHAPHMYWEDQWAIAALSAWLVQGEWAK